MTTESTQPQPELGPAPDNGQGQSQGHRRRRRRRRTNPANRARRQSDCAAGPAAAATAVAAAACLRQASVSGPSPQKEKFFQKKPGSARHRPQQHLRAAAGQAQDPPKGPARVVRSHGSQLPHRQRQHSRRSASTIHVPGNGHGGYYSEAFPQQAAPSAKTLPPASSCSLRIVFLSPKLRRPRASSVSRWSL